MKPTTTLATSQTRDGTSMVLQEHDGEFFLKIGGVSLMSTTASWSEQEMAQLACGDLLGKSARVLIGGLGFGFTLKRVLELVGPESRVTVVELLPEVVKWNRQFLGEVNGGLLDDPQVTIQKKDVFSLLRKSTACWDVILLDVDNSPDALVTRGNARLYQRRGLEMIRGALAPGGRVVFWSANRDKPFEKLLGKVFSSVESVPAKAYEKAKRFSHTLFVAERD